MNKKLFFHNFYYIIEFLLLVFGFILIYLLSFNFRLQFMVLIFLLIAYFTIGVVHHKANHYFSAKIVIEYILISCLVLAGFLFLNIGKF